MPYLVSKACHWVNGVLLILSGAMGCSSSSGSTDGGADACQATGHRLLSIVGNPSRTLHPGTEETLQVVFMEQCAGPIGNENILFEIKKNPGDSSLSADSASTDPQNGVAEVTLQVGNQTGDFQVWAHHPDDPTGVMFSIFLKPVRSELRVVGQTNLTTFTEEKVALTVKVLDVDTNAATRGVDVEFVIETPAPGNAFIQASPDTSNLSGLASSVFNSGKVAGSYKVYAQGVSNQLGKVSFNIEVEAPLSCSDQNPCPDPQICVQGFCHHSGGSGLTCNNADECPDGYTCPNGLCESEATIPDSCTGGGGNCPPGFFCEQHTCFPCKTDTQAPECLEDRKECEDKDDCPPGYICINGECYPENPQDAVIPDLSGTWYTRHYFDVSKAVPEFKSIQEILDILNKAINFCQITGIDFVDELICELKDEYVPPWVGTLIDIFTNLSYILSELRVEGQMDLIHLDPMAREFISGSETWDTILIRYLPACCENQGSDCNPYEQPDFPECATIDITREDLDVGEVGIAIEPFTCKVHVDTSGATPKYTLYMDPRKVHLEYSNFVSYLIDLLIQIFTGYDDLEEALEYLIDCEAIQLLVDDMLGDYSLDIVPICEGLKPAAGPLLRKLLDEIGVGWKALQFKGLATIAVNSTFDPPYGTQLGYVDFEDRYFDADPTNDDGYWEGTFTIVIEAPIKGAWYAER